MSRIHPKAFHYRFIATDYGATYTHRAPNKSDIDTLVSETLPAIGTFACRTCVGVYFKVSANTYFAAHINASHYKPLADLDEMVDERLYDERIVTLAEGTYVYDETIRRLEDEARRAEWPDVGQIENVVMVCPYLNYPVSGEPLSGQYVVQGIRDFLRCPDLVARRDCEGFVVTHETDKVEYFPFVDEVFQSGVGRPLADDCVNFVAHETLAGDETARWFIDVDEMWRARMNLRPASPADRGDEVEECGWRRRTQSMGDMYRMPKKSKRHWRRGFSAMW